MQAEYAPSNCSIRRWRNPGRASHYRLAKPPREIDNPLGDAQTHPTLIEAILELKRAGSQPSQRGPEEFFTGTVRIDPLSFPPAPARTMTAYVTFEPGARSAWHTHPLGQTLIVTAGCGWTQCEGGPIVEIRAGDVVWCPPDHKHWHGATPTTAMTHIAVTETLNGIGVNWLQKVADEEYLVGPPKTVAA
jgi:quercetin dioxygenase-like cupin family protein